MLNFWLGLEGFGVSDAGVRDLELGLRVSEVRELGLWGQYS